MKIHVDQLARHIAEVILPGRSQRGATKEPWPLVECPTAMFNVGRETPTVSIDAISKDAFPSVGFTFRNGNKAPVVLRQIRLQIESIELNLAPAPSFRCATHPSTIKLFVRNNGWGPAESLRGEMSEPLLDELFSAKQRSGSTQGESAEEAGVLELSLASAMPDWGDRVGEIIEQRRSILATLPDGMKRGDRSILRDPRYGRGLCNLEIRRVQVFFDELAGATDLSNPRQRGWIESISALTAAAARVNDIDIRCTFTDVGGRPLTAQERIVFANSPGGPYGQIWLTRTGFSFQPYQIPTPAPRNPDVVVLLHPSAGPVERTYAMSLTIPASGAERFAVFFGANRSCDVRGRWAFHLDGNHTVASAPFELKISFPVNGYFDAKDGTHFVRTDKGWTLADKDGRVNKNY